MLVSFEVGPTTYIADLDITTVVTLWWVFIKIS